MADYVHFQWHKGVQDDKCARSWLLGGEKCCHDMAAQVDDAVWGDLLNLSRIPAVVHCRVVVTSQAFRVTDVRPSW